MLTDIFKNLVKRITADPGREYEDAKRQATQRITGCGDPVTREKLRAASLEADKAMNRLRTSMRGMR